MERLLAVAQLADPDPWRDLVRDPEATRQALHKLAKQIDLRRQSPQVLILLAARLPPAEAAALLRRVLLVYPQDFWLHFDLGNLVQEPDERAGCFQAALALRPSSSAAHSNWGNALKAKGDYDGAIGHYAKALQLDPKGAKVHYIWGNALLAKGENDGAIGHYAKALDLDPKDALAHVGWGDALAAKRDYARAIDHFAKALELDPKDALAHTNWGVALFRKQDYNGAIDHFAKALELDPKLALAHYNWGNTLYAKQDYDGAIARYTKAIQLDPKLAEAHGNLSQVLLLRGELEQAHQSTQRFLQLLPPGHPLRGKAQLQLKLCQQLLQQSQRAELIVQGQAQPTAPVEALQLAYFCWYFRKHAAAARLYALAFTAAPTLADSADPPHRSLAARSAVLAAAGLGRDAAKPPEKDRTQLRQQALTWLQADLQALKKLHQSDPSSVVTVQTELKRWLSDPDLASVRDAKELARLPAEERQAWQQLWAEVEKLTK
jgi:tetratricopeptide (TPR) repeat protein